MTNIDYFLDEYSEEILEIKEEYNMSDEDIEMIYLKIISRINYQNLNIDLQNILNVFRKTVELYYSETSISTHMPTKKIFTLAEALNQAIYYINEENRSSSR